MARSFLSQLARTSHEVSKYAGDANAYQRGGLPRLSKRVARRYATRTAFQLARKWTR